MGVSNFDIIKIVQHLKIPNFKGVFMRDELKGIPDKQECAIINFNKSTEPGSHWVAYFKDQDPRMPTKQVFERKSRTSFGRDS